MRSDEIAKTVLYCRKLSGLSQQGLARLAGIGKTAVFDIEKGKETVRLNTLLKIFDVLNIQTKLEPPVSLPSENKS